jgi:hypothetical protein
VNVDSLRTTKFGNKNLIRCGQQNSAAKTWFTTDNTIRQRTPDSLRTTKNWQRTSNSLRTTQFDRKRPHALQFQHTVCHKNPAELYIFKHEQLHAIYHTMYSDQHIICHKNPAESHIFKHEQLHAIYHIMYYSHPSAMVGPLSWFVHSIYSFFFVKCSRILSHFFLIFLFS